MAKTHSLPVDPPQQALDWMSEYQKNALLTFIDANGTTQPLHGVSFDVDDIAWLIANLNKVDHKVFLGLALTPEGGHTIVASGLKVVKDASGAITDSFLIHNATHHPILDFARPCPDLCPDRIEKV